MVKDASAVNATTEISPETPETATETVFADPFVYLAPGQPALKPRQIGLVPGAEVPLMPVTLPGGLRGHAREQVAERQMRDALAAGRDGLEIRPFVRPATERDWARVLVAESAALTRWRKLAGPAGRAVLPDYLALPAGEGVWTLARAGASVLARLGPQDGFSATPAVAGWLLKEALATANPPPKALLSLTAPDAALETLCAEHNVPLLREPAALAGLGLEPPRALAHGELELDLRRDPRAARARLKAAVLPWRWPLLVAALAAGLWAGAQMRAIDGLETQTERTRAATLEMVRADFVPEGPVLDIRTQVSRTMAEARVAAAGSGAQVSPLDLLGLAAEVMTRAEARPELIDYTAQEGLRMLVRVADFAAADALAEALRAAGLAITVVESRVSGSAEGVRTELRLAAPEAGTGRAAGEAAE